MEAVTDTDRGLGFMAEDILTPRKLEDMVTLHLPEETVTVHMAPEGWVMAEVTFFVYKAKTVYAYLTDRPDDQLTGDIDNRYDRVKNPINFLSRFLRG